jgi:hypothetical protein
VIAASHFMVSRHPPIGITNSVRQPHFGTLLTKEIADGLTLTCYVSVENSGVSILRSFRSPALKDSKGIGPQFVRERILEWRF